MDHGHSLPAAEDIHVVQVVEDVRLADIALDGEVVVTGRRGSNECGGDSFCRCWDGGPTLLRARASKGPDTSARRLSGFPLYQRPDSPSRVLGQFALSASTRTLHSPMYMSPFSSIERPLDSQSICGDKSASLDANDGESSLPGSYRTPKSRHGQLYPPASILSPLGVPFGATAPPTPPEDIESFTWTHSSHTSTPSMQESLSSEQDTTMMRLQGRGPADRSTERPSTITLPYGDMSQHEGGPSAWLGRAIHIIGEFTPPDHPATTDSINSIDPRAPASRCTDANGRTSHASAC